MNNCINCKYYNNGKCNNKYIPVQAEQNFEGAIIDFTEQGYLSEALEENIDFKELNNIFLNIYNEAGATKKNKNDKKIMSELEDKQSEIIESLDEVISTILLRHFKNSNDKTEIITIKDPYNFSCNMWE